MVIAIPTGSRTHWLQLNCFENSTKANITVFHLWNPEVQNGAFCTKDLTSGRIVKKYNIILATLERTEVLKHGHFCSPLSAEQQQRVQWILRGIPFCIRKITDFKIAASNYKRAGTLACHARLVRQEENKEKLRLPRYSFRILLLTNVKKPIWCLHSGHYRCFS